jgi:predicted TIM-barrel fold metal-dependent hydrolase
MKICCEKKNNAKELIAKAFAGIEEKSYLDIHVHLVGNESKEGNQAWRRYFYRKAFKVKNLDQLEQDAYRYFESLVFKEGTYGLLAIDQVYDETGALQVKKTFFHVRNETIFKLAARNPHFFPIASIHPYRKDACDQLDMWAEQGIRTIKWLPNAMQIDPSHELCLPFYKKMAQKKKGLSKLLEILFC